MVKDARETCAMSTGYAGAHKPRCPRCATPLRPSASCPHNSRRVWQHRKVLTLQQLEGLRSASESSSFTSYNIAVLLYP